MFKHDSPATDTARQPLLDTPSKLGNSTKTMSDHLPLNALRAFEAAARHLNFSKAAEELFVTPSAISQHIRTLENRLGVKLFQRKNRSLTLTEQAQAGLPKLKQGWECFAEAMHQIRQFEQQKMLTVWTTPSFAVKWLVRRLDHFSLNHPEIDMQVAASLSLVGDKNDHTAVRDYLLNHNVDIIVQYGEGHYPGCRIDKRFDVVAVPLCSPALLEGPYGLKTP